MATDPKVEPKVEPKPQETPIDLPPSSGDLVRQLKELREWSTAELAEVRKRIDAMTPAQKEKVEAKIEKKAESKAVPTGDWLYDLMFGS
jgi:hypothetical protein